MNFIFALFFCYCLTIPYSCHGAEFQYRSQRILSEPLIEMLEKLRQLMREGNPEKDIPIMDPFKEENIKFDFDTPYLNMEINGNDITLAGLSDFEVHNVDLSMIPLALKFGATLPLTKLYADNYNFTGMVFKALPIYGKGLASFEVGNFFFSGVSKIAVGLSGVYLRDLRMQLYVDSLKSETTGMLGGGDIDNVINAIMADMAPDFFNANSKAISERISAYFLTEVNEIIKGMSLNDLINLIKG